MKLTADDVEKILGAIQAAIKSDDPDFLIDLLVIHGVPRETAVSVGDCCRDIWAMTTDYTFGTAEIIRLNEQSILLFLAPTFGMGWQDT